MNIQEYLSHSYNPYSGREEACIVESKSGNYFPGIRIENISFPLTISAVQCAICCCISEGEIPASLYAADSNGNDALYSYWTGEYDLELRPLEEIGDPEAADVLVPETTSAGELLASLLNQSVTTQSDFPVSALVETEEGYISGVNIEHASWEMGLCAERVAIAKALAYGYTNLQSLHVHTKYGEFSSPCGACRQVIMEHMPHHPVVIHHPDKTCSKHYSSDLLPYSFKSESLKKHT